MKANEELDRQYFDGNAVYEPPCKLLPARSSLPDVNHELDNPKAVEGAPGAVQVMGRPMRDEELIEILKIVEDVLGKAT